LKHTPITQYFYNESGFSIDIIVYEKPLLETFVEVIQKIAILPFFFGSYVYFGLRLPGVTSKGGVVKKFG
jgi:hypothetical protein